MTYIKNRSKTTDLGQEEAELIARCKRGDIKSYELLYNRFSKAMYHTCIRVVMHDRDAEDILQESFMEAFINLSRLKDTQAFGGWIKRIVLNKAINHVKRDQKKWLEPWETDLDNTPEETMIHEYEYAGKLEVITGTIQALTERDRLIINLHVFEEISFEEMAGLMNVSASTLRSRYSRIKQKILKATQR